MNKVVLGPLGITQSHTTFDTPLIPASLQLSESIYISGFLSKYQFSMDSFDEILKTFNKFSLLVRSPEFTRRRRKNEHTKFFVNDEENFGNNVVNFRAAKY